MNAFADYQKIALPSSRDDSLTGETPAERSSKEIRQEWNRIAAHARKTDERARNVVGSVYLVLITCTVFPLFLILMCAVGFASAHGHDMLVALGLAGAVFLLGAASVLSQAVDSVVNRVVRPIVRKANMPLRALGEE